MRKYEMQTLMSFDRYKYQEEKTRRRFILKAASALHYSLMMEVAFKTHYFEAPDGECPELITQVKL